MDEIKRYLIAAIIEGKIDYKIVHTPEALDCKQDFFCDYGHPKKPDYILELPTSLNNLHILSKIEKILEESKLKIERR